MNYYGMYARDPEGFGPRYTALLRNGFDAPPATLLKRFLDLDLHDPRLVPNALSVLEEKLERSDQE